jgi:FtsP/CotA-like multicopper oxidase with cupredoxin domain
MGGQSTTETFFELNIETAVLLPILWGAAALGAGRLALRPSAGSVRRRARLGLVLLGVGLIAVLARVLVAVGLAGHGWRLAADFTLTAAPTVAVPAAAVVALSFPRYWRLARLRLGSEPAGRRAAPRAAVRRSAAAAELVVPVQATAAGTVLNLVVTAHPPAAPYLPRLVIHLALLLAVAAGLWVRHRARAGRLGDPGYARPRWRLRILRGTAVLAATVVVVAALVAVAARSSRLPDRIAAAGHAGAMADGGSTGRDGAVAAGGPVAGGAGHRHRAGLPRSVTTLVTADSGTPDRRFTLAARRQPVTLASGETVQAWAFNGQLPGPQLRMRAGELVEVTLVNVDVPAGVTLHWHGLHLPNAEDGAAGLTQDAVLPGGSHTYRFRPSQVGTFWYHTHQDSAGGVFRGLFGAVVVEPAGGVPAGVIDEVVVAHAWDVGGRARTALNASTGTRRVPVAPGTQVRLRLVNADNCPRTFALRGTGFTVAAIDGVDLAGPTGLTGTDVRVVGGGRYDLVYTQPAGAVALTVVGDPNGLPATFGFTEGCGEDGEYGEDAGGARRARPAGPDLAVVLGPPDAPRPAKAVPGPVLDPAGYGTPAPTPFDAHSHFDRSFELVFGISIGFYDGHFAAKWTINNGSFPDVPPLVVNEGDLVKLTVANRSFDDHPFHLHGHHVLVLTRNGRPVTGSPWWTDSLNLAPGDTFEVAFRADNPGLWMLHCHNLDHVATGMMMHLAYSGITTPYEVGRATPNRSE